VISDGVWYFSGCVVFGRVSGDSAAAYLLQQASSVNKATTRLSAVAAHLMETRVRIDPAQSKVHLEFSWDGKSATAPISSSTSSVPSSSSSTLQVSAQKAPEPAAPAQAHATEEKKSAADAEKSGGASKEFTTEDVSKHNKKDDIWVIVNGQVLDVTKVRVGWSRVS
jgi:Cytochrome b5-like Heme/Steroid binding domain